MIHRNAVSRESPTDLALSQNLRAAVYMSVSMSAFAGNDAITKAVAEAMNVGQIMLVRGMVASILILGLAWHQGVFRQLSGIVSWAVIIRAGAEVGATTFFLVALSHMPIANVSAVLQALPLAVTMGAALVFKETVGWRRWLAIAAGLAGVLIIVRPGFEGFNVYSLYALVCVMFCAVRDLATKRVPAQVPTLLMTSVTALAVTATGAALIGPFGGWSPLGSSHLMLLVVAAVLLLIGYQFIISAMREGEISFVAPFRYTALIWSMGLGVVVFSEIPDLPMIAGAIVIVGSGLYTLYRERMRGGARPAAEATSPTMQPDGI